MDELHMHSYGLELAPAFKSAHKRYKLFTILIENQQILIVLTAFLSVSDILALATTCQDVRQLIQKHTSLQNRILKAQVRFLSALDERRMQNSRLNSPFTFSAYSVFQSYWDVTAFSLQNKVSNIRPGKTNLAASPIAIMLKIRAEMQKKKSIKAENAQTKEKTKQSNPNFAQKFEEKAAFHQYKQSMENDHELHLLTKWQYMARQREIQEREKKIQRRQVRPANIRNSLNSHPQYVEVQALDESLVVGKQTFWDRVKQKLSKF